MASAPLTVTKISRAGVVLGDVAATADGNTFQNTGYEFQYIQTSGTGTTLTIAVQATLDGQAVANKTVTLASTAEKLVGPFPTDKYNDANGNVVLTYSSVTGVTASVMQMPQKPWL